MSDLIDRKIAVQGVRELFSMGDCYCDELSIVGMLNSLPSQPKWIPVTERLPEKEKKSYWICTDTGYQCKCRWTNNIYGIYESNEWGWSIFDIPQYTKVVAWMTLPEPWKGE